MKNKIFYDIQHAHRYLRNCIIRYKDRPIYVADVQPYKGKIYRIIYYSVGDKLKELDVINTNDEHLCFDPVPLGLCNTYYNKKYTCYFTSRIPARMWKIGLNKQNLSSSTIHPQFSRNPVFISKILNSRELKNTIQNKYPSLNKIMQRLSDSDPDNHIAFSRNFAMSHNKLFFQNYGEVGKINNNTEIKLFEECSFLKEMLQEDLRNAN